MLFWHALECVTGLFLSVDVIVHAVGSFILMFLFCSKYVYIYIYFFFIWVFFHEHSRITGLQGKGEGISLTPHYHFHPLHRHLDISRAIAAGSSPLHIASSRTQTGNLWFPCLFGPFFKLSWKGFLQRKEHHFRVQEYFISTHMFWIFRILHRFLILV